MEDTDTGSTSSLSRPLCVICNQKYAIYTCPRCTKKTCSLGCSKSHKSGSACSGERDKAAYVPMNAYGWGTMMDDYSFLEDVGRKVGDWGKEIVKGGFVPPPQCGNTRVRGRGRGRGGTTSRSTGPKTKRDILKIQLDASDIEMDLLPVGMERRKQNQSYWDYKNNAAYLTVEFRFHPPVDPLNPNVKPSALSLLTHRNSLSKPLLSLIQTHLAPKGKKESPLPEWVRTLVMPHPDDPEGFVVPHCLMSAPGGTSKFYSFHTDKPLTELLQHTQFVEFPTIDVWEKDATSFTVVRAQPEASGWASKRPAEEPVKTEDQENQESWNGTTVDGWTGVYQPKPKRRKLTAKAGKKAIVGLLGDYGSDEEDGPKGKGKEGVLAGLGGYAGSSDEEEPEPVAPDIKMETEADPDYDEEEEDTPLDPAVLLALMQQAAGGRWKEEEEAVDWGESDGES